MVRPSRSQTLAMANLLSCLLSVGCAGEVGGPMGAGGGLFTGGGGGQSGGSNAGGSSGGAWFTGGSGAAGGISASGGAGGGQSSGGGETASGGSSYVEPECPDEEPPPIMQECDPLAPEDECGNGRGCYPYIQYPAGERCGFAQFGARCVFASSGAQGDTCGGTTQRYCEPGFLCVVGAGGGARCARICSPGITDCSDGLICTETDVKGFGVCF